MKANGMSMIGRNNLAADVGFQSAGLFKAEDPVISVLVAKGIEE